MSKKQILVYFVASTYINCKMEASVSVLCLAKNGWETVWRNLESKDILYFRTEEDAKKHCLYNNEASIHFKWVYEEEVHHHERLASY